MSVREASCGPGAWRPLKQVASGQNHSLQRSQHGCAPAGTAGTWRRPPLCLLPAWGGSVLLGALGACEVFFPFP